MSARNDWCMHGEGHTRFFFPKIVVISPIHTPLPMRMFFNSNFSARFCGGTNLRITADWSVVLW